MSNIKIFENKKVRSQYDADKEMWYFSIVDIVGILTEQPTVDRARNYWKVLKSRLIKEGNETVTNCNQLKLQAEDGKLRLTDVGNVEDIFRLIQSTPVLADVSSVSIRTIEPKATLILKKTPNGRLLI
jgi:hypothetical protein